MARGACTLVAADAGTVDRGQMKSAIRCSPATPAHGASIVATITINDALRAVWEQELTDVTPAYSAYASTVREYLAGKRRRQVTSALLSSRTGCSHSAV